MPDLVRAGAWKGVSDLIIQMKGDAEAIFAEVGVPADILQHPNSYMPISQLLDTIELAAKRLQRPDFGLLSGEFTTTDIGTISLAIMNSRTARAAIEMGARFIHIHNPSLTIDISNTSDPTTEFIAIQSASPRLSRSSLMVERHVSGLFYQLKSLFPPGFVPPGVWLTTPQFAADLAYESVFGTLPTFEAERAGIFVGRADLDRPRSGFDEEILKIAEARLSALSASQSARLSDKVALLIKGFLPGPDCSIDNVASILGVHSRTLQRRLKSEGRSFEDLKDDVKRQRAEELLAEHTLSLTDIAFMLGYSESSTFSRKARDWFGMSPRDYRKQY